MQRSYSNPCTRCGKERIVSRTWEEYIQTYSGAQIVQTNSETICPDASCQKIVDEELSKQKEKREKVKYDREQRKLQQKTSAKKKK